MYCGGDDIGALVADIGTTSTRIGFAGEDYPRSYFPSAVGVIPPEKTGTTDMEVEHQPDKSPTYSFNPSIYHENMTMEYALRDGVVANWNHFEKLWDQAISSSIKVDMKETPVLLAEKSYNSSVSRQKMCELMFEKYNIPALFVSKDAVLSCYACGKTTGVVVDCGGSGTVVTPINEGWAETTAISRSIVGGLYMDAHFLNSLTHIVSNRYHRTMSKPAFYYNRSTDSNGQTIASINPAIRNVHPSYHSYMSLQMIRDLKETVCRTAESATCLTDNDPRYVNIPLVPYILPDGSLVEVGAERYYTPELLFDPSKLQKPSEHLVALGLDSSSRGAIPSSTDSIDKLVLDSILRCDPSTQANLVSTMIVTGGNSSYDGMPERIRNEVEKILYLSAPAWKMKMLCATSTERPVSAWLGGSIIASLGSLHDMWMARSEYDEYGAGLIDRKCP